MMSNSITGRQWNCTFQSLGENNQPPILYSTIISSTREPYIHMASTGSLLRNVTVAESPSLATPCKMATPHYLLQSYLLFFTVLHSIYHHLIYYIWVEYLFTVFLPKLGLKTQGEIRLFCSLLYPQKPEECLSQRRHSINLFIYSFIQSSIHSLIWKFQIQVGTS